METRIHPVSVGLLAAGIALFAFGLAAAQIPSSEQIKADLDGPFKTTQALADLEFHGPLAKRLEPILIQQARYLISTLHPWGKDPKALSLTTSGSDEHNIRPNAMTVGGLAVVNRCIKDGYPDDLTPAMCKEKAVAILRFLLPTHGAGGMTCDNNKPWKNQWQSAHWATAAGRGAWLLWDDLDAEQKWLAARMICDEADRFVGKTPPAQVKADTKAEENAWNSEVIALAFAMFPNHPHREQWKETALVWSLSSFVSEADLARNPVVDGKPLRDRINGATIYDDCTLENHNRVHPDYMGTFSLCNYQRLVYEQGGLTAPEAVTFNTACIYGSLKKLSFPDGGWIYPNGQDWRLHRNTDWINIHVANMAFYGDAQAARLARIAIDVTERMAARDPKGGIYAPGEYFFPSTQHSFFDWTALSYLMLRAYGEGPAPVDEDALWKDLAGRYLFETGKFGVLRTPKSVSTFSWGAQVMGMVLPIQKDLLLGPHERSLIGVVGVKGVEKESPAVKSVNVMPDDKVFAVAGIADRAAGKIEQRFAFVALPDGRALYLDSLRPTAADIQIDRLELGPLSVLNDANWVYHDGTRTLYAENGKQDFTAAGEEKVEPVAMSSPWYNLDDALGIVCLRTSGKQSYLPNHKPERARTEQWFCLNLVDPKGLDAAKSFETKSPLAETALVFFPAQPHRNTEGAAARMKCEQDPKTKAYLITLDDRKTVRVDLEALKIEWK